MMKRKLKAWRQYIAIFVESSKDTHGLLPRDLADQAGQFADVMMEYEEAFEDLEKHEIEDPSKPDSGYFMQTVPELPEGWTTLPASQDRFLSEVEAAFRARKKRSKNGGGRKQSEPPSCRRASRGRLA